jgi:hypothetical protein
MALVLSVLTNGFMDLAIRKPKDAREAARRMALTYGIYARSAQAAGTPGIFTGLETKILEGLLYTALQVTQGVAVKYGTQWAAGLTAFWMTPPIVFAFGPVTGFVGAPVLIATLTAALSNPLNTDPTAALQIATALHAATLTVVVTGLSVVNLT